MAATNIENKVDYRWRCCRCQYHLMYIDATPICPEDGHRRCADCTVEEMNRWIAGEISAHRNISSKGTSQKLERQNDEGDNSKLEQVWKSSQAKGNTSLPANKVKISVPTNNETEWQEVQGENKTFENIWKSTHLKGNKMSPENEQAKISSLNDKETDYWENEPRNSGESSSIFCTNSPENYQSDKAQSGNSNLQSDEKGPVGFEMESMDVQDYVAEQRKIPRNINETHSLLVRQRIGEPSYRLPELQKRNIFRNKTAKEVLLNTGNWISTKDEITRAFDVDLDEFSSQTGSYIPTIGTPQQPSSKKLQNLPDQLMGGDLTVTDTKEPPISLGRAGSNSLTPEPAIAATKLTISKPSAVEYPKDSNNKKDESKLSAKSSILKSLHQEARQRLPLPYKCPKCRMGFRYAKERNRHFHSKHFQTNNREKPHICTFPSCAKEFSGEDNLKRHTRIHNDPNSRGGGKIPPAISIYIELACIECVKKNQSCNKKDPCDGCLANYPPLQCTYTAGIINEENAQTDIFETDAISPSMKFDSKPIHSESSPSFSKDGQTIEHMDNLSLLLPLEEPDFIWDDDQGDTSEWQAQWGIGATLDDERYWDKMRSQTEKKNDQQFKEPTFVNQGAVKPLDEAGIQTSEHGETVTLHSENDAVQDEQQISAETKDEILTSKPDSNPGMRPILSRSSSSTSIADSLFSDMTGSSMSSFGGAEGVTERLATLLLRNTEIKEICLGILKIIEGDAFEAHLRDLLKGFAKDLGAEADTKQKLAAKFVKFGARNLAHMMCDIIRSEINVVHQNDHFWMNKPTILKFAESEHSDSERSEDEDELDDIHKYEIFINNSQALQAFVERLREFSQEYLPQVKRIVQRQDTKVTLPVRNMEGDNKENCDSKRIIEGQVAHVQDVLLETREKTASIQLRYLKQFCMKSISWMQSLAQLMHTPILDGKKRIKWECKCGQKIWDDFEELHPGAAEYYMKALLEAQMVEKKGAIQSHLGVKPRGISKPKMTMKFFLLQEKKRSQRTKNFFLVGYSLILGLAGFEFGRLSSRFGDLESACEILAALFHSIFIHGLQITAVLSAIYEIGDEKPIISSEELMYTVTKDQNAWPDTSSISKKLPGSFAPRLNSQKLIQKQNQDITKTGNMWKQKTHDEMKEVLSTEILLETSPMSWESWLYCKLLRKEGVEVPRYGDRFGLACSFAIMGLGISVGILELVQLYKYLQVWEWQSPSLASIFHLSITYGFLVVFFAFFIQGIKAKEIIKSSIPRIAELERRHPDEKPNQDITETGSILSQSTSASGKLTRILSSGVDSLRTMTSSLSRKSSQTSLPIHTQQAPGSRTQGITQSPTRITPPQDLLFLLICYPSGRYGTKLLQLDLITLNALCDKTLFHLLRTNYLSMQGKWLSRISLRKLASIKFVNFEMYPGELVDVRKVNDIPPPEHADYKYAPAPPEVIPPIGDNHLMHLFHNPSCATDNPLCLSRFPKKLKQKLLCNGGINPGWGLQFVESWDVGLIWLLAFVFFALGSLLFGVLWAVFEHSIQDAFAIAGYMVTFATVTVGSLQALMVM